ncbi:Hypothetical predicted protein, partial [Pelobates cultripes]
MSTSKSKKSTSKAEKMSFFGQKTAATQETAQAALQDGFGDSDAVFPPAASGVSQTSDYLTRGHFERAMDAMATKLIHTWQSTADQIKKEVRDLSSRTASVEIQCQDLTSTQADLTSHVQTLQNKMGEMEARMADYEDRMRRNNLRL